MPTDTQEAEAELAALSAEAFDDAGIDLTQIDLMLDLSPADRLRMLCETAVSSNRLMRDADADAFV